MENKIKDFLINDCGLIPSCCVNYRPIEYNPLIESISFIDMVEIIKNDIIDLFDLFDYIVDNSDKEKIIISVLNRYKKHIVKF